MEKYTEKSECMYTAIGKVAWYKYFRKLIGSVYAHLLIQLWEHTQQKYIHIYSQRHAWKCLYNSTVLMADTAPRIHQQQKK